VSIEAAGDMTVANGGLVTTDSNGNAAAGNVIVDARRLEVRNGGLIGSSGSSSGPAGNVRLVADTLEVDGASIRTEGTVGAGGRIEAEASDLIALKDA
jgi:hypothetical protein